MKIILSLSIAMAAALLLPSCNTMIGLGRDMRIGGEGLEKSANKAGGSEAGGDAHGAPVY